VGHANRSWFHDAISLDAQSRRLCLSFVGWRRHSNTDTNSYCDGNGYGYGDGYGDGNGNC
jgi:hypothetical protein